MKKRRKVLLALLLAFTMTASMGMGSMSVKASEVTDSQTTVTDTADTTDDTADTAAGDESGTADTSQQETSTKTTVTVTTTVYQVTASSLCARTEPSTRSSSTVAFYLSKGTQITSTETVDDLVTGSARKWAKFTKDGKTYYCSTNPSYITVVSTTTTEVETEVPSETDTTNPSENPSETPSETPSESETVTGTYYKVTASALNVRSGAGTSYSKLGTLSTGTVIEVTETATVGSATWGKFNYNGQDGWVSLAYCTETTEKPSESSSTSTTGTKYQITASSLNMRSGPGTSYSKVGSIPEGEVVTVTETQMNGSTTWGKTTYNGVTGWISLAYATTNISSSTSTGTVSAGSGSWKSVNGTWTYYDSNGTKQFASNTMYAAWTKIKSKSSSTSYYICVNCSSCQTFIFKGSANKWVPFKLYSCSPGASSTPTVKGTFTVSGRGYSFGTSSYTCYYYTQFYGNYLFHSVLYYAGTFNVKDGRLGQNLSHGCVRLALDNAKYIYNNIPNGTKVYTY